MLYELVFAEPAHLQILCRRGHFILMDSIHQTNKLFWLLYTLMVRDEYGSWIPSAYIITARKDSDIVTAGLDQVSTLYSIIIYKN